ncbi:MAG: hypothetical protein ABSE25_09900 [Syntrophorhabdales bacterium]
MSGRDGKRYFQDPLFEEFRADTCYVCCRRIRPKKGICVGQGLWRHAGCRPGGRRWSESSIEARLARAGSRS